jgi:hypothetical protein
VVSCELNTLVSLELGLIGGVIVAGGGNAAAGAKAGTKGTKNTRSVSVV